MYFRIRQPSTLNTIQRRPLPLAEVRRHFRIALIDDSPFPANATLRTHGFSVMELGDIRDIAAVEAYPIVACDIKDVGVQFQSPFEGAHLIAEIRKRYPDKYIIAYSGGAYGAEFKRLLDAADVFVRRGVPVDDWIDILDTAVKLVGDPVHYWKRIRTILLEYDTPTFDVFLLEEAYIRSIQKRDAFVFEQELQRVRKRQNFGNVVDGIASAAVITVKLLIQFAT